MLHPLARSLPYAEESWLAPKNRYGIGTNTYMNAARHVRTSQPTACAADSRPAEPKQRTMARLSAAATSCAIAHNPALRR